MNLEQLADLVYSGAATKEQEEEFFNIVEREYEHQK